MKIYRKLSITLLIFTAINAIIAGTLFIIDPSGSKIGMSVDYLKFSPFKSFLIPGIILFLVNGILNIFAAFSVIKNRSYSNNLIVIQGILLCGWIFVQILMVHDINILHIIMFIIGLVLILSGWNLKKLNGIKK